MLTTYFLVTRWKLCMCNRTYTTHLNDEPPPGNRISAPSMTYVDTYHIGLPCITLSEIERMLGLYNLPNDVK